MLYAMLGVSGLALASWFYALPFLGGDPPSATGPMLLPARLIILPLAVLIGGFVLAFRTHTQRPHVSTSLAIAFVLTLLTGAFYCVVLSVEPLSSYLQATYAADAQWLCLVLFGAMLVTWVVVYDGLADVPGQRFVNSVGWLHCLTVCIGLPAIWWTWFALGVVGLPGRVADARQFEAFAAPSLLQAWLTGLLAIVLGIQLISAVVLLAWWLGARVLGERNSG
jgi:heme/copper-type cytochrome/quinol oxidase subunit 1